MSYAFKPCVGTRAQIDATPVVNGQFLVASDTGESFVDVDYRRIQIAGGSSSGDGTSDDDDDDSLFTFWSVASPAVCMSDSVSGGGPGSGLVNTPTAILHLADENLTTDYSITGT